MKEIGHTRRRKLRWGKERIKVKEMRYLEYKSKKNESVEKHVVERIRKVTLAMKKTQRNIREKREMFSEKRLQEMKKFDTLMGSIALVQRYGGGKIK